MQQIYPQKPEIFFITGRDAAERILTWPYDDPAAALAKMFADFQLLVFERQGKFQLPGDTLVQKYRNRIRTLEIEENLDTISSTVVRKRVSEGRSITELVPVEVAAFIQEHSLYRDFAEE